MLNEHFYQSAASLTVTICVLCVTAHCGTCCLAQCDDVGRCFAFAGLPMLFFLPQIWGFQRDSGFLGLYFQIFMKSGVLGSF